MIHLTKDSPREDGRREGEDRKDYGIAMGFHRRVVQVHVPRYRPTATASYVIIRVEPIPQNQESRA